MCVYQQNMCVCFVSAQQRCSIRRKYDSTPRESFYISMQRTSFLRLATQSVFFTTKLLLQGGAEPTDIFQMVIDNI